MSRELGDRMVADDRFKLLTFTGSPSVGWRMKERAGKKKVVLELGGNAGVIVDKTADLDWAVKRASSARSRTAGQVCISVQRMFVHEDVWDAFMDRFVEGAGASRSATRSIRRPTSGRWSTGRARADPALGRRGRRDGRQAPARRQGRRPFFRRRS
jgi:acyl-CoA reductase-like NAD-dependent aldehyde dehydrogenase